MNLRNINLKKKIYLGVWHKCYISHPEQCKIPVLTLRVSEQIASRSAEGKIHFDGDTGAQHGCITVLLLKFYGIGGRGGV